MFNSSATFTQWSLEPGPDSTTLKWNVFSLSVVNLIDKAFNLSSFRIIDSDSSTSPLS